MASVVVEMPVNAALKLETAPRLGANNFFTYWGSEPTFLDDVLFLKLQRLLHILTKLEKMTSRCITMLDLQNSGLSGQDAERFTVVLIQLNISIQTMLEDSKRR